MNVTTNVNVRPAQEKDFPLILLLIQELADYEKMSSDFVAEKSALHSAFFSARPAAEVLIGELDGNPVGFAVFFHTFSTWLGKKGLFLDDLFVRPSARGHGVGKALLIRLAQIGMERDCGRLEWNVLDWNAPSIAFYKSLGAAPMDGWTVYRMTRGPIEQLAHAKFNAPEIAVAP